MISTPTTTLAVATKSTAPEEESFACLAVQSNSRVVRSTDNSTDVFFTSNPSTTPDRQRRHRPVRRGERDPHSGGDRRQCRSELDAKVSLGERGKHDTAHGVGEAAGEVLIPSDSVDVVAGPNSIAFAVGVLLAVACRRASDNEDNKSVLKSTPPSGHHVRLPHLVETGNQYQHHASPRRPPWSSWAGSISAAARVVLVYIFLSEYFIRGPLGVSVKEYRSRASRRSPTTWQFPLLKLYYI
jgi:hypothetical protein